MNQKRRALVLGDEAARHPFRRSLPPHIRASALQPAQQSLWQKLTAGDFRSLLTAYSACLVAVLTFIV